MNCQKCQKTLFLSHHNKSKNKWCKPCFQKQKKEFIDQGPITCITCNKTKSERGNRWCESCYKKRQDEGRLMYQSKLNFCPKCNEANSINRNQTFCKPCFQKKKDDLIRQGPITCIICNKSQSTPGYRWCESCYKKRPNEKK